MLARLRMAPAPSPLPHHLQQQQHRRRRRLHALAPAQQLPAPVPHHRKAVIARPPSLTVVPVPQLSPCLQQQRARLTGMMMRQQPGMRAPATTRTALWVIEPASLVAVQLVDDGATVAAQVHPVVVPTAPAVSKELACVQRGGFACCLLVRAASLRQ